MSNDDLSREAVGRLLGLLVHDIRNPLATVSANADYLADAAELDQDAREALEDVGIALGELRDGLELVAWIGRWLGGQDAVAPTDGDLVQALSRLDGGAIGVDLELALPPGPLQVKGGASAGSIARVLLVNSREVTRRGTIKVSVAEAETSVAVTVTDEGRAIADELQEAAFEPNGHHSLKGRPDGRYSRYGALLAVRAAMDAVGGSVSAGGEDGAASFTLTFPRS